MTISEKIDIKTWVAFISMVFGMFMAILDIQIVASSIKEIQAGLFASLDEINMVQTSYLIAEVIIIPISGWLAKAFSTRILFAASCAGFTIASIACSMAWDLNSMVVFRSFQGLFGGSMIPLVFSSIYMIFPVKLRSTITVIVGLVVTIAPITGPLLGGYITEYLSWKYLFLLNIIPGILVTFLVLKFVNFDQSDFSLLKKIDFIGIILIAIFLGFLQYVLEEGNRLEWFDSNLIILLSIISFISFISMIIHELRVKDPVVELHSLKNLNFAFSCFFSFIIGWGLYTSVLIVPMFLSNIQDLNSIQISKYLCVVGVFQLISAPCAGFLVNKMDSRLMLFIGFIMFGIGVYGNSFTTNDSSFEDFLFSQAIRGFSLMFCFLPITNLAYATLPIESIKSASGLYNLMRNLGGAVGIAVTNSWLTNGTDKAYSYLSEKISSTNLLLNDYINSMEKYYSSADYYNPYKSAINSIYYLVQRESFIVSFNQVNVYISLLFFISSVAIIFIKNSQKKGNM